MQSNERANAMAGLEGFNPTPGELDGRDAEIPWYVAYTQVRREQVAVVNLQQQGFEAYLPLYKSTKKIKGDGTRAPVFEPMFPRYVFFRPGHSGLSICAARSTRGVSFLLSGGCTPAVLKPQELLGIRRCESLRNEAGLEEVSPFQPGLQVRLRDCGLHGLEGLVKSVTARRVTLLLELLGRSKTVSVAHHQLELA